MDGLAELLQKIEALPAVGKSSPLRALVEQLHEIVDEVEAVERTLDAAQVRAIVHEEVVGSETRVIAALQAEDEAPEEPEPTGLSADDVRNVVDASLGAALAQVERLRLAVESVAAEVRALAARPSPTVAAQKITPAEVRKIALAPVHLEIDVERRLDGRIGRFIVNER